MRGRQCGETVIVEGRRETEREVRVRVEGRDSEKGGGTE